MYIRTKDGRIAEVKENMVIKRCSENVLRLVYKDNQSICVLNGNDDIISQSEALEELCDEFVIEYFDESKIISIHNNTDDFLREHKDEIESGYIKNVYGAVWTSKGLIYVAKMDDEGNLELI